MIGPHVALCTEGGACFRFSFFLSLCRSPNAAHSLMHARSLKNKEMYAVDMEGEWNNEDQTHQISNCSVYSFWVGIFQPKAMYTLLDFVHTWLANWALLSMILHNLFFSCEGLNLEFSESLSTLFLLHFSTHSSPNTAIWALEKWLFGRWGTISRGKQIWLPEGLKEYSIGKEEHWSKSLEGSHHKENIVKEWVLISWEW